MRKKGFKTMAVTAVAGCLILSLSATAFAYSGSGYAGYKEAIKSTIATKNATVTAQYEVKDKGVIILSGNSTQKLDNKNSSSKTSITVDGITKAFETSKDNGNLISKADGKYFSANKAAKSDGDQNEGGATSANTVKLAEMLTDTLVGDVKNQFVQDGQTISVKLEGAQIPELARLALSAAAENSSRMGDNKNSAKQGNDAGLKPMMDKMPKLSNIAIKSIAMTATVDGSTLKDNKFTVAITGTDAKGVSHELELMLDAKITDVGNTKIDVVDTTGKEVTALNRADHNE